MGHAVNQMLLQVTVSADASPELFQALVQIRDPKRRIGRLRDLATCGLLLSVNGFAPITPRQAPILPAAGKDASPAAVPGVVDGLTDWTEE